MLLVRGTLELVRRRIAAIIPVIDEEGAIGPVLAAVPREWVDEVIVVDGGSHDRTVAVASAAGAGSLSNRRAAMAAPAPGVPLRRSRTGRRFWSFSMAMAAIVPRRSRAWCSRSSITISIS